MSDTTEEQDYSLVEYFRKNVTLPRDSVTVYLDGAAAWEYMGLFDRQAEIVKEQARINTRIDAYKNMNSQSSAVTSIADEAPNDLFTQQLNALNDEYEHIDTQKRELFTRLSESGVTFDVQALYPSALRLKADEGTRIANEIEGATPSDGDKELRRARTITAVYLAAAVKSVTYPNGHVVNAPFTYQDFLTIEDYLDREEYGKLVSHMNKLNMRAAIRDAREDAGFPGGRTEQAGE